MIRTKLKSLASDTMIYGVAQTVGRFLAFLLIPLYSNYLSKTENGIVATLFATIALVQLVYGFGMETAFFRFFEKDNEEHNKKVFSVVFFVILVISLFATAIIFLFSQPLAESLVGDYPNAVLILLIAALIPLADMIIAASYAKLRMQRQTKHFALTRCLIIFIATITNIIFLIFAKLGILGVFVAQLVASTIGIIIFLPDILKSIELKIDKTLLVSMLRFALPTLPASLSAVALQTLDKPIMSYFLSDADTGVYQINAKLAVPMMMIVSMFDYAWKPFYLSHYSDEEAPKLFGRVLTYFTLICAGVFLVVALFLDNIVRIPLWNDRYFIAPEYWQALYIVPIILLGYFFSGVTNNFAAVFHITKKTKYLPLAIVVSAVVSIGLNLILIPTLGFIGASISLVVAYFVGMLLMKLYQKNVGFKINYEWQRIVLIVICAIIVFVAGILVKSNVGMELAFLIKILLLGSFILLLKLFGFFSSSELLFIKNFVRRRH